MTNTLIEDLLNTFDQHPVVTTDSRNIPEGSIFFALKGPTFDGNNFVEQALQKGAVLAVTDDERHKNKPAMLYCQDVLSMLQQLALAHRKRLNIPVIGITGSNGKTTTKELVHAVLSQQYKTSTTVGNLNNHIGIPLTLLRIPKDAEMAVIEMGANHQKEIAGYCTYTQPTHGMITNCGKAHLEGFGGVEGIKKGKGELFDFLALQGGKVFVCADFTYFHQMIQEKGIEEPVWYGSKGNVEVEGSILDSEPFLKVSVKAKAGEDLTLQTQLVGAYNLYNVLAAVTIGRYFGVPDAKIKKAIESYAPDNSRSQLVKKGSNTIIFDAYNANPSSMAAAIDNFSRLSGDNKILILGAMAELGEDTASEHRAILEQIKQSAWQTVVLVGAAFKPYASSSFLYFENAAEASEWWKQADIKEAQILLKGSRSSAMEKVMGSK